MHERVKAAKFSRDPEELYQVGLMFRDGTEIEQDFKEAKDWFRRAAYADHPGALFSLGVISAKNLVSNYSSEYEIKSWLNKAIKLEHAGAKTLLELIEADEELPMAAELFAMDRSVAPTPQPTPQPPEPTPQPPEPTPQPPEPTPQPPEPTPQPPEPTPQPPEPTPQPPEPTPQPPEPTPQPPLASTAPKFDKDLSCATTQYQPSDLTEYDNEPWDIRISLDNAPLEDAYYFTVKDPSATNQTIQQILEEYALNTSRSTELDTNEYPQLPHIQQELLGYYQSGKSGQSQFSIYINKRPASEPVSLSEPASSHLSTCVFHDGAHDYKLLDLVFVIDSKPLESDALTGYRALFGSIYMLFLIDYCKRHSPNGPDAAIFSDTPFQSFLSGDNQNDHYPQLTESLQDAADIGWIFTEKTSNNQIFISDQGYDQIEALQKEVEDLTRKYERFQSVSVNPPALGVPDGFDVRIQIMRFNSIDVLRAIFLFAFLYNEQDLFGAKNWADSYESGESFSAIYDAFQYETDFSEDVIRELTQL